MNVAEQDDDPFCKDEADWQRQHYQEVYMVATTFNPQPPPLLTSFLTS